MKEILIIRSVSFQQLDLNLENILDKFKDHSISLLTHEHGVKLAEKYARIQNIYVYPYKEGFSHKRKVLDLKNKEFDAVILPVTNISGVGFSNVFLFGATINAKEIYSCNVISEIKKISKTKIFLEFLLNGFYKMVSIVLTIPTIIIFLILSLFKIKLIKRF